MSGRAIVDGAVVTMGGDVYFTNRIHDGFAVVDTGAPGVEVKHQNNLVGVSDSNGKLLVPSLAAYHANKISIDPRNLPIDAEVDKTSVRATPAHRSGIYVDFQVKTSVAAAIVILHGSDGRSIPTGSEVFLNGDTAAKALGYDGQVYLNDLKAINAVSVSMRNGGNCTAKFNYTPEPGTQTVIGPIVCH